MEEKIQALPCFEINPILLEDRKKYIYGVNRASGKLFLQLCSLGIEIDGFIETGENCGMVFRKPVFQEDEIESEDAQVLVSQEGMVVKNGVYCNAPVVLNGEINIANIVIYGAGIVGQKLKRYLEDLDIHVRFFVDSDKRKNGISIDNLKVYGREVLCELSSDTTVIVAGKSWREMNEYLIQNNIQVKRFYESGNNILSQEDFVVVDAEKEIYLDGNSIVSLNEHYGDRRIIVYGVDCQTSCKIARCLSVFGFENICVAYDEEGAEEKTGFGSLISIYDILYTEDAYVVLLQDLEKEERLLELGLQKKKDYLFINECDFANRRVMHFDLNLGYIYDTGEDFDLYPGMYIYGKNKTEGYKIAVLGGSTTDGGLYSFASWSEILHQKYLKDDVTIYNCGMCGYSSG
ncbi:MAG: hypothetical protein IJX12_03250, partial [Lachnospiraceae bacterium]|nr:hypothetical protein [Lachnospiraceae bacterium]